jgi:WD40 repeat protein
MGCAFSPDGQVIVSASYEGALKAWDAQTGEILATFLHRWASILLRSLWGDDRGRWSSRPLFPATGSMISVFQANYELFDLYALRKETAITLIAPPTRRRFKESIVRVIPPG